MAEFPRKAGEWTELSRETVYENPWIKVEHSTILNPNGGDGIYGKVHFKNLAIGVLAITDKEEIFLVGQERFPFDGAYSWEIIEGGGPIEIDPLESAKRELKEETGLEASEWEFMQEMHLSNSVSDERSLCFIAKNLTQKEAEPEDSEKLKIKKLPFQEALQMVLEGEIKDSISVAAILQYALRKVSN
ncbi:NUDIX domain-containing protein [Croceimicrobium sp.]|uniref:NUDIX domain-containing protein n=1 Tax=Croceimicrobium sp. TaxID=2828340 RepID=UPI003BAB4A08